MSVWDILPEAYFRSSSAYRSGSSQIFPSFAMVQGLLNSRRVGRRSSSGLEAKATFTRLRIRRLARRLSSFSLLAVVIPAIGVLFRERLILYTALPNDVALLLPCRVTEDARLLKEDAIESSTDCSKRWLN